MGKEPNKKIDSNLKKIEIFIKPDQKLEIGLIAFRKIPIHYANHLNQDISISDTGTQKQTIRDRQG